MCGIFGIISKKSVNKNHLNTLALHARQRGQDSSGIIYHQNESYLIKRENYDIKKLLNHLKPLDTNIVMGHSRLITNGLNDNQPVIRDDVIVIHNGIIINTDKIWKSLYLSRTLQIDTEVINGIAISHLAQNGEIPELVNEVISSCKGTISCILILAKEGKAILFSNNGSLYTGEINSDIYFSSESFPLKKINCSKIKQIWSDAVILDIPKTNYIKLSETKLRVKNLIPKFKNIKSEEKMLEYHKPDFKRCSKCILPETMPYILFDTNGICNYCLNYTNRNNPRPKSELFDLVKPYRRKDGPDCIIPFSGGRDSSYGLHLIVKELKMKPITYTYDWGMVTDLGRRNISRMCSELKVENIIVAADISKKRRNIAMNLKAWLRSPHLGMVSILTAGDKHFFRYVETVKRQTGINLNLWGVNPLEVTHFKAGFLGVKPDFEEKSVYMQGISKQLKYQWLRLKAMARSPRYFNSSIWDTISGEFYRSFKEKKDYFHIYDYWKWDESLTDKTLAMYDWELAPDTNTTWRIGDGTAAFYNYIYKQVAGFTEHDTFRSNQIREGDISRKEAIELVKDENRPRYQNIRWYLDTINMDFEDTIKTINSIPKLYKTN
jgi:glucosamine--fructose-6-phosphate aminotransferase (isomerizing)